MKKLQLLIVLSFVSPIIHAMDAQVQATQQSSIRSLDADGITGEQVANGEESEVEQKNR